MTNSVGAVLLDTRSIQKYVFSCNELKTNVGASYIVDRIFNDLMCKQILPSFFSQENLEVNWEANTEIKMKQSCQLQCEVVYIGGGNMLLLVRMETEDKTLAKCREIVKAWSKNILLSAPGLHTGVAIGAMDISTDALFKESLGKLYAQLKQNQNNILPNVDLPYTGLTKECDVSGKAADAWDDSGDKLRMVASEVKAKINAYEVAEAELQAKYKNILQGEYCFANEFEKIGYREGESYLSVIHIDGNNMGVKFSACRSAQERKELSKKVSDNVEAAFTSLLQSIVKEYPSYENYLSYKEMVQGNKKVLPIRPIIIGGDDVTFVCPGRLGIAYAKRFMEAMATLDLLDEEQHSRMEQELQKTAGPDKKLSQRLSCCAGVAIVSAKYPFFRAYELAEQLCDAAKQKSRQDDTSWLDFAILHGEKTPELEQLRRQQYVGAEGYLHYGPYKVDKDYQGNDGLEALLALEGQLSSRDNYKNLIKLGLRPMEARNKIKKLREVLTGNQHAINIFFENTTDLQKIMREETRKPTVTAEDLWEVRADGTKVTRYIDAIELMDFRPEEKER